MTTVLDRQSQQHMLAGRRQALGLATAFKWDATVTDGPQSVGVDFQKQSAPLRRLCSCEMVTCCRKLIH